MALTKDLMALTTGYNGTHKELMELATRVMSLTRGYDGTHNRV